MKLWKKLTPENMETIPLLRGQDFELMRNLGVVLIDDEVLSVFKELRTFNQCIAIRCSPTLDLYQDETEPVQYPNMLLILTYDSIGYSINAPLAIYDQDEEMLDQALLYIEEEKRIQFIIHLLNTPAPHPHVATEGGVCTGEGSGQYALRSDDLIRNQANVLMQVLDLKRWASSVNLGGAFYTPSTYITSILRQDIAEKIYPGHASFQMAAFRKFENQEEICFFAGFLKGLSSGPLKEVLKKEFNNKLIIEIDQSISGPIKVKRIISPFSIEQIKAFYVIDSVVHSVESLEGIRIFDGMKFDKDILDELSKLFPDKTRIDYMYKRLKTLLLHSITVFEDLERIDFTSYQRTLDSGKHLMGLDQVGFVFETEETLITFYNALNNSRQKKFMIDFTDENTVIHSALGGNDELSILVNRIARIILRIMFVEAHNALIEARQTQGVYDDLLHYYQGNGGKDPLLP